MSSPTSETRFFSLVMSDGSSLVFETREPLSGEEATAEVAQALFEWVGEVESEEGRLADVKVVEETSEAAPLFSSVRETAEVLPFLDEGEEAFLRYMESLDHRLSKEAYSLIVEECVMRHYVKALSAPWVTKQREESWFVTFGPGRKKSSHLTKKHGEMLLSEWSDEEVRSFLKNGGARIKVTEKVLQAAVDHQHLYFLTKYGSRQELKNSTWTAHDFCSKTKERRLTEEQLADFFRG